MYKINENVNALSGVSDDYTYRLAKSNQEIIKQLKSVKIKPITEKYLHSFKKFAIPLMAAVLLLALFLPGFFKNNIQDYYNFDDEVPFEQDFSVSRSNENPFIINEPEVKSFLLYFMQGMSAYLANDYQEALNEWNKANPVPEKLADDPEFKKYYSDFIFYNAVCRIALVLSKSYSGDDKSKQQLLQKSEKLFLQLNQSDDKIKYFYALNLALLNKKTEALIILNSIPAEAPFYRKSRILKNHLLD